MRTSFLLLLVAACAVVGCGDDTSGAGGSTGSGTSGSGGSGSGGAPSGSSSTVASGSTTASTGSSGEGGGGAAATSATTSGSTSSTGGFEPADTVQEACENLNAVFDGVATELGCPTEPGDCDAPVESCEPELLAFINCLVENVQAEDCVCDGGGEDGAGGAGTLSCEGVASVECTETNDALEACLTP
jgi:hypothetical protein